VKSILEVDSQPDVALMIPRPLSELLRETDEKKEDTIRRLEEQRRQVQGMIKRLQRNLEAIKKRLRTLN
jgi:DNA-binding transcriptional MerR regulator